jgi:hypothetical protein
MERCYSMTGFLLLLIFENLCAQQPVSLNRDNPHYLQYQGKPIILITAAEHYGSLINLDFDYVVYLDALKAQGMNYTRVFAGSMLEREEDIPWMKYDNTLAPRAGRVVLPWARSAIPGYRGGGNKFDLDQWDNEYFLRLKNLLAQAEKRGVIVELTFFGNQYKDGLWENSPLHPDNNIQSVGPSGKNSFKLFQTLHNKELVSRQEGLVAKILSEVNSSDNVFFEVSNEPYNEAVDSSDVNDWHRHMVEYIKRVEASLPKKHLIATNESVVDHQDVSIANYHYVKVLTMPDFDWLLSLNKVLSMDETLGSLVHSDADDVRVEAWDFILRGGGIYNNLSWEHTPDKESGTPASETIRNYLMNLQLFMSRFDYVKMKPADEIVTNIPDSAFVRVLSEIGKQYAIYIHHSKEKGSDWIVAYDAKISHYTDLLTIDLPKGNYTETWTNPSTGQMMGSATTFKHPGGRKEVKTPEYVTDIALEIKETKQMGKPR